MSDQDKINKLIGESGYLVADGATGTNLFALGLESGQPPELWNMEAPEKVALNHRNFIKAGASIILTNTFGANHCRLKLHNLENQAKEINYKAACIAKDVASEFKKEVLVAGSMGPTGELMYPLGKLTSEDAKNYFYEQAKGLKDGDVDIIWIETLSDAKELECAILAAKKTNIPIICTYSFDTHGKSMMGLEPKDLAKLAESYYPNVIGYGANCGTGTSELIGTMICLAQVKRNDDMHLIAKGNCGIPSLVNGNITYTETPAHMALYAKYAQEIGADIIGGCCGTRPEHIEAMSNTLKNNSKTKIDTEVIMKELGNMSKGNISLIEKYLYPERNKESLKKKSKRNRRRRNT